MNNILNFLRFFEETTEPTGTGMPTWVTYVFLGGIVVVMILLMVIPQRRNKKKNEEMMSKLKVGAIVTTIGGIIGEVIQLDESNGHMFLETGVGDKKTTMEFTKGAIYMIQSPEEIKTQAKVEKKEDEVDEIK